MTPAPFDEPWHSQLFALTVALNEAGHLDWSDWAGALGATLARRGAGDGGDAYYAAWLEALEGMLAARGLAGADLVETTRAAWEAAYLATPHGHPVRLGR